MKWFLDLPQWLRISIALAVVAAVFVWVKILVDDREEAELTFHDQAFTWPAVPVLVDNQIGENKVVAQAIDDFNDQVGCKVVELSDSGASQASFVWEGSCDDPFCYIPEYHDKAAAGTWIAGGRAWVVFRKLPDIRSSYISIQHELGHVMGLAHDTYELMKIDAPTRGDSIPLLTPKDRAALYDRYCANDQSSR